MAILGTPIPPATAGSILPNHSYPVTTPTPDRVGLNSGKGFAPARPPPRQEHPEQPIHCAEAGVAASGNAQAPPTDAAAQRTPRSNRRGSDDLPARPQRHHGTVS